MDSLARAVLNPRGEMNDLAAHPPFILAWVLRIIAKDRKREIARHAESRRIGAQIAFEKFNALFER